MRMVGNAAMSGGQGGSGADPVNGTGGQPGADEVANGTGAAGGNGGASAQGSGGGAGGAAGSVGGAGGNGGAAAGGTVTNTSGTGGAYSTNTGSSFFGGAGGAGLAGPNPGDGGGGGGGGSHGQYLSNTGNGVGFTFSRTGGTGGAGGAGNGTGGGGGGGSGGYGFVEPGPGSFIASAQITGGNGGAGGAAGGPGGSGGSGGDGGIGLFLYGSTGTNTGQITGGNGGLGGAANGGTAGIAGQGGAGLSGANIAITNTGTISGGFTGGSTTVRAVAINVTGGTNSLTPSTGTLNGGLGIAGGATTLRVLGNAPNNLGPVANAGTFDISGTTAGASITTLSGTGGTTLGAQALTITNGSTSYSGAISGTGGVAVTGGTQTLTGVSTYSGGTAIGSNGGAVSSTLQLGGPTSAGTGTITFGTMSGTATARLGINVAAQPTNGGTFANTISNFGSGNEIALAGLTNSSVSYNSANSSITITGTRSGGGQVSENFVLSAPRTTSFAAVSDGQGGTIVRAATAPNPTNPSQPANPAPCYVTGTRIRVLRDRVISDVPVEQLAAGDLAITAAGTPRPIRWIGTRAYRGSMVPPAERPVRIRADALGEGVPARDLFVSPDHCLWLDGLLAAAGHLVNGSSITRGEAVADLAYWHVELDTHDLLLAENAPAESFLAAPGVRGGFDGVQALDVGTGRIPYAPRAELGPDLAALRGRLALRAVSLDGAAEPGPVRAWLDRCGVTGDGLLHVGGWARDEAHPDTPLCLDVLVDGAVVAFAVAAEFRSDLAAAGFGDGRCGFDLGVHVRLAPHVHHRVEVRRSADGLLMCAKRMDAAGSWIALLAA